jgi:hypothetical protein
MPDVVMWTVWWERNRCTFEDLKSSVRIIEACVSLFLIGHMLGALLPFLH